MTTENKNMKPDIDFEAVAKGVASGNPTEYEAQEMKKFRELHDRVKKLKEENEEEADRLAAEVLVDGDAVAEGLASEDPTDYQKAEMEKFKERHDRVKKQMAENEV